MEETTALGGMTAIRDYCRILGLQCSEASIISLIKACGFPARKLGGQWLSDKVLIKTWIVGFISEAEEPEGEPPQNVFKRSGRAKKAVAPRDSKHNLE